MPLRDPMRVEELHTQSGLLTILFFDIELHTPATRAIAQQIGSYREKIGLRPFNRIEIGVGETHKNLLRQILCIRR